MDFSLLLNQNNENKDEQNELNKLEKQVLLFEILSQAPWLTENEFMNLVLDSLYLDYFEFTALKKELIEKGFIIKQAGTDEERDLDGQKLYRLAMSSKGKEVYNSLYKILPLGIRNYLMTTLREWRIEQEKNNQYIAFYTPAEKDLWRITLKLNEEGSECLLLSVPLADEDFAKKICQIWRKDPSSLYQKIMKALILEGEGL